MLQSLTDFPIFFSQYQYIILLLATIIEGPITMVIAGFLAAQNLINVYLAYVLISVGDLIGDVLYYFLGRWGRQGLMNNKLGRLLGVSKDKVSELESRFLKHGGKTILLSKLAHGIGTAFLFAAGAAKMPIKKFIFYNVVGTIPKSLILLLIGYFFGQAYARINQYFDYFAIVTFAIAMLLTLIYYAIVKISRKKENI